MVAVKLMPLLAKRATSRRQEFTVPYQADLTPAAIAESEGFTGVDLEAIMALVNGTQVELDSPLADGDQLELMVGIAGG